MRERGHITGFFVDALAGADRALKLHLGAPNPAPLDIVRAVRDTVGPEITLMVDVHTTRDVSRAIELGRGLEAPGVRRLESPTAPEGARNHAEIARCGGHAGGDGGVAADYAGVAVVVRFAGVRCCYAGDRPNGIERGEADLGVMRLVQHADRTARWRGRDSFGCGVCAVFGCDSEFPDT